MICVVRNVAAGSLPVVSPCRPLSVLKCLARSLSLPWGATTDTDGFLFRGFTAVNFEGACLACIKGGMRYQVQPRLAISRPPLLPPAHVPLPGGAGALGRRAGAQ